MKQTILLSLALLAIVSVSCGREDAPAQAPSERKLTEGDRTRFVYFAVLEGLWEEGADRPMPEALLNNPWKVFVPKCPICMPVMEACRSYVKDIPRIVVADASGTGFPNEVKTGLKSSDRAAQLKALESMVQRYVSRRFDRTVMNPDERTGMTNLLLMGKKTGMTMKEQSFGDFCPSCNGATNPKK
jgi:hypothetical protein